MIYVLIAQPRPTGLVRQLMVLLEGAAERGLRPRLFCLVRTVEQGRLLREAADRHGLACEVLLERSTLDTRPLRHFLDAVHSNPPDVVQTHGYKPSVYGAIARLRSDARWVAFYHGRTTTDWRVRAYHMLDRLLMRRADAVVAVAPGVEDHFSRRDRGRLRVVPNGMLPLPPPNRSRPRTRDAIEVAPEEVLAGFVGRFSYEKGPDLFLRTIRRLGDGGLRCKAVLVGEGPLGENLQELAVELGIAERVTFTGQVRNVAEFYGAMDLLVVSSRSEVFPNVLLEAVDAGLPVASTPVGGIPVVARGLPTVALSESVDVEALAEAAIAALDSSTAVALDESRVQLANRYSPEIRVDALCNVYSDVLDEQFRATR